MKSLFYIKQNKKMQKVHEADIPPCDSYRLHGKAMVQVLKDGVLMPPEMTQAILDFKFIKGSATFTDEAMFIYDADTELKGLL